MTGDIGSPYRYWAFISYSSKDMRHAKWLHHAIERYGIPAKLFEHGHKTPVGEPAPRRLQPVFLDRAELSASPALAPPIQEALATSRYLIVICSPHAAQSEWVEWEIETFIKLDRCARIFAFVVDGEPNSGGARECFPPTLRQQEPLAADARKEGDGRNDAKLKLLAGMLGVGFDELKHRDAQRRMRFLELAVAGALALALILAGLTWYASRQRHEAVAAQFTAVAEANVRATAEANAVSEASTRATAEAKAVAEANARATTQSEAEAAGATAVAERNVRATAQAAAEDQRRIAVARQLAAQSRLALDGSDAAPVHSLLLAVESMQRLPSFEADQALRLGLRVLPRMVTTQAPGGRLGSVAFSPDGSWLAAGGSSAVWLWETRSWLPREVVRDARVHSLSFGKESGLLVAAIGRSALVDSLLVWDTVTGTGTVRAIGIGSIRSSAISPDGRWFVAYDDVEGVVRVWEIGTGREVARLGGGVVFAVAFSPDGSRLATGGADHAVRVWDMESWREVAIMRHSGQVIYVQISPDGRSVAASDRGNRVCLWDIESQHEKATGECWGCRALTFSPNGDYLVGAPTISPGAAYVWEIASGRLVAEMPHQESPELATISPDSQWLATASAKAVHIWEIRTGLEVARVPHDGSIGAISFSPDGRWLASASADGSVRVSLVIAQEEVLRAQHPHADAYAVSFGPDNGLLATGGSDGTARLWDLTSGQQLARLFHGEGTWVEAVAFSPDGLRLATGTMSSSGGSVWLWNTGHLDSSGAPTGYETIALPGDAVDSLEFSQDGQWLAVGSHKGSGGTVRVWSFPVVPEGRSTTDGEVLLREFPYGVEDIGLSRDGSWMAVASGPTIHVLDTASGSERASIELGGTATSVAIDPEDRRLAATGWAGSPEDRNGILRVWDLTSLLSEASQEPQELLSVALRTRAWTVEFSRDGRWLAAGTADGVRMWDVATGRELLREARTSTSSLAFSADGRLLAAGGSGDTASVWLLEPADLVEEACARLPRNLTLEEWRTYLPDEPCRATCPNLPNLCTAATLTPAVTPTP